MDDLTKKTIQKCSLLKKARQDLITDQAAKTGCEGFYNYWQSLGRNYLRAALAFNLHNLRVAMVNGEKGKAFHIYHGFLITHLKEAKQKRVNQDLYHECNTAIGRAFEEIEKIN